MNNFSIFLLLLFYSGKVKVKSLYKPGDPSVLELNPVSLAGGSKCGPGQGPGIPLVLFTVSQLTKHQAKVYLPYYKKFWGHLN